MRSAAAEREWRWRAGPGAQRAGDAREGERGLREQAGASWAWGVGRAVREKGLAQGREWAVAGWAAGEGWTGLLGWFFWVPFLFYF